MELIEELKRLATVEGLELHMPTSGHVQIIGGGVLVNWYPTSKRRTAYVAGAVAGKPYCSPRDVIALALGTTDRACKQPGASRLSMKKKRRRLFERSNLCHWCGLALSWEQSTVDHLVPLGAGGSNRGDNLVLSCQPCNTKRGHKMPHPRTNGDKP